MIETAFTEEELKRRMKGMGPFQGGIEAPVVPKQDPSIEKQFGDVVKNAAMEGAVKKGTSMLFPAAGAAAPTGMAGKAMAGLGAGISTAVPYIGLGLAAAKLFGLFSAGGKVKSLASGAFVGPLSDSNIMGQTTMGPVSQLQYKSTGGEVITMKYGGPLAKGE